MYLVHLISIDLELSRSLNSPTLALLHKMVGGKGSGGSISMSDLIKYEALLNLPYQAGFSASVVGL